MLKPGDPAPELTLVDQSGRAFNLSDLRGRKHAVIFFYPKDNTLVCTREACAFRDRFEEFVALGAVVVGVSDDDAGSRRHPNLGQPPSIEQIRWERTARSARHVRAIRRIARGGHRRLNLKWRPAARRRRPPR